MFMVELKKYRENANLSQAMLANKLGVSQATVGMWESGKREPNFAMLCKLADYFGISTDSLLGRSVSSETSKSLPQPSAELMEKFSRLDPMAQARIMNALNFEYQASAGVQEAGAKLSRFA